ncbi:MAG TPA: DUF4142 domain-containing protein [Candidatus Kapabacteria bacterium]|nr:DUF4142 domain-containing protein [Candidatus Kapabacteria bacterium]
MRVLKNLTAIATAIITTCAMLAISSAAGTPKLTDPEIASIAVTANQIDVNYGKLALKQSKNPEVIKFANAMIKDHESIIKQASALATRLKVTPKDNAVTQSLLKGEKEIMAKFKKLKGEAFDKAYIENEVNYHAAVISTVKDVLIPQTKNAELKDMFVKVSPLLDHHLEMAKMAQSKIK